MRKAYTLMELVIAIAVVAFLATLTALYFPKLSDGEHLRRGSDLLQQHLVQARTMAQRDRAQTGVQFLVEADGTCRHYFIVQEPGDTADGLYVGRQGRTAWFQLLPGRQLVAKPGDFLVLHHHAWRIDAVGDRYLVVSKTAVPLPEPELTGDVEQLRMHVPANYSLVRQPERIPGEQITSLPEGVRLVLAKSRGVTDSLVFDKSGTAPYCIMWLEGKSSKLLITVSRHGFVGSHPVAEGDDPYMFAQDARGSGL